MTKSTKRIYLSPPHMSYYEQQLVSEAFSSNWIAPVGPHVEAFEKEVANFVNIGDAVALSSGTAAIHLALKLLDVGSGDYVFCSTLTFVASANPILYQGAEPIFIDSEPDSWNMSPNALEKAFKDCEKKGKIPKAVIIVNLYGQSADMSPLLSICERYGVPIIEDAAESLGAIYKGRASGTFGRFGIYSFNGNKIITTSGGGILVSQDLEGLEKARFWATQARDPAKHYQHSEVGYNYRLSNVLAAIGRGQLRVLNERIEARRIVFKRYFSALKNFKGIEFMPEAPYGRSTRWLTALTIDPEQSGVTPTQIIDALEGQNIEARPVWKPLHLQPLFKNCPYYPHNNNSVSDDLFRKGVCLPSGSNLSEEDQDRIIECLKHTFQQ
ncbi:pyridoxal phosphate-dependent aminotransferase EpsN [Evansella vedderi]|uniref:Pyridoxal phosphate-dependent aminotransferase EpsN n=1 Tax=Evansella vedderi TaxID=38282 RepID=A0ABT9ZZ06_9BACI|nr:aminotransferase class I/II-fold pyridoxal phosphate-dependent enzyme [Evansella vedderi]MDQ0255340.1 pyridoxal phosphate-dependent aminotransferase EpsN [Evansella vedderi]